MTNLCALILADHGELDLHAPVAHYWPEFAANDKERIEVRHLLVAHLPGWPAGRSPSPSRTSTTGRRRPACWPPRQPWWEPGTASGYHAVTQGYLVGEVVRRVTGQSLGTFFAEEVAGPLGADFLIGLPPADDHRVGPRRSRPRP